MRIRKLQKPAVGRRGAVLWMVLLILPVIVIISFMAINVAFMNLSRTELSISTDAGSRAGGRMLAISGDPEQSKIFARDASSRNLVAGDPLLLADSDFEFGRSERNSLSDRYVFASATGLPPNSLRLTGRRTEASPSGVVHLFSPEMLSIGTFSPTSTAITTQIELDICLVVDRSGSMAYADDEEAGVIFPPPSAPAGWDFGQPVPTGSRWINLVNATQAFLDELAATPLLENVGLVTYSETATPEVDLTPSYAPVMAALDPYTTAFPSGATNIGGGLIEGVNLFGGSAARPWATKVIVLMTDGIHNYGTNPVSATQSARDGNIIIYTVTFSDEADQRTMELVARKTNGLHIHAATGTELVQAFRDIAHQLPTLLTE